MLLVCFLEDTGDQGLSEEERHVSTMRKALAPNDLSHRNTVEGEKPPGKIERP